MSCAPSILVSSLNFQEIYVGNIFCTLFKSFGEKKQGFVPQVLNQVVNLSCYLCRLTFFLFSFCFCPSSYFLFLTCLTYAFFFSFFGSYCFSVCLFFCLFVCFSVFFSVCLFVQFFFIFEMAAMPFPCNGLMLCCVNLP